jgi:L-alanine-DL-glutamate epimerase-like enolase superfamily enzyme
MTSRRNFFKYSGIVAGGMLIANSVPAFGANSFNKYFKNKPGKMKLRFKPYDLQLKHVFTIASNSRTSTPVMLVELEYEGVTGYGEASMPPYLGETQDSAAKFLSGLDLSQFSNPFLIDDILEYVDKILPGNYAAKASVDIALHDLVGKLIKKPWFRIWGLNPEKTPNTSFTIGIDTPDVVRTKVAEADEFKILKVKLGRDTDKEMIETIRSVTNKPICADINQGWKDKEMAIDMIHWLKEKGVVFIEQPMSKTSPEDNAWLTERSPLPIIADEALQTVKDVLPLKGVYSGINIKLMKCGGLRAANKMITIARACNMKVMMGCMTETSCAISAAAQLSPLVDWADLDGNLLISNDLYDGIKVLDGKIVLNERPGIGLKH